MRKGIYQHYKGQLYQVLYTARHSETLEKYVVYQTLYGKYDIWIRPEKMFKETVLIKNKKTKRFKFIQKGGI